MDDSFQLALGVTEPASPSADAGRVESVAHAHRAIVRRIGT